jgi:hypothetical protein
MRALFAKDDAYVFTTWSGGVPVDNFIQISKTGFEKGVKIAVSSWHLSKGTPRYGALMPRRMYEYSTAQTDARSISRPRVPQLANVPSASSRREFALFTRVEADPCR